MNNLIESWYSKLASIHTVALFFVLMVIFSNVLFPQANKTFAPEGKPAVIRLQLAFNKTRFVNVIEGWLDEKAPAQEEADIFRNMRLTIGVIDTFYPLTYAIFFASALALFSEKVQKTRTNFHKILFVAPFFAAASDLIENFIHLNLLWNVNSRVGLVNLSESQILAASIFASIKIVIIAVSVSVVLYYLCVIWLGRLLAD